MDSKQIELFERFIASELSLDELLWFNSELEINSDFANEFETYKNINEVLSNKKYRDLSIRFKKVHDEKFGNKKKRKINLYRLSVAASFLIVLTTSFYFWFGHDQQQENNKLFSTEYSGMVNLQNNQNLDFTEAVIAYNSHDFKKSANIFYKLLEIDSLNEMYKFNLAIAYLGDENYNDSKTLLENIIEEKQSIFMDNAQWYLAVIYYKTKNYDKAIEIFKAMANNSKHYKTEEALKAIELIEKEIG